jgi:hypothetical protein
MFAGWAQARMSVRLGISAVELPATCPGANRLIEPRFREIVQNATPRMLQELRGEVWARYMTAESDAFEGNRENCAMSIDGLSPQHFADRLGVSRPLVMRWIKAGLIAARQGEDGRWAIPVYQQRPRSNPTGRPRSVQNSESSGI